MDGAGIPSNVYIVLGSYNGARFIQQQIKSIQEQSFRNWKLLIRDDCSSDNTTAVIHRIADTDPRIILVEDDFGRQGVVDNFGVLLQTAYEAGADYVFLADQDDVWNCEKVDEQLNAMQRAEAMGGTEEPLLVHSDLAVVDGQLNRIRKSFMAYQHIRHEESNSLATLLVQNFVTGCGTLVNRSLLKIALPLPDSLLMHDWWLALCAATFGRIVYVNKTLVLYRQHERNVVGARGWRLQNLYKAGIANRWRHWTESFHRSVYQAEQLCLRVEIYERHLPPMVARIVRRYCDIFSVNRGSFHRIKTAVLLGIRRQRVVDTLALYASIFLWRETPGSK